MVTLKRDLSLRRWVVLSNNLEEQIDFAIMARTGQDRLDHKDAMLQQLNAKLKHHQSQSGHGKEELQA